MDDISHEQFSGFIDQSDSTGESHIHVTRDGEDVIWDYRHFNLEAENIVLKFGVVRVLRASKVRTKLKRKCSKSRYSCQC